MTAPDISGELKARKSAGPSLVTLSLVIAAFIAVIVVAGLIGAISDRRIRRKTSERNIQLDAALNNMSQGLCMFGPDNRLQLWNERYVTMYRLPSASSRWTTSESAP